MKGIDVISWSTDPVRHLHRHGSWFTFCNLDVSANALDGVLVNRYPLYKAKRDAPTCLLCVGRAMCNARK